MPPKGKPYRPRHRLELDRLEARRIAAGVTIEDLCLKAALPISSYRRMRRSGLAFKRHVNALAMAMRTLESEARRDDDLFPFSHGSGPGQPQSAPGTLIREDQSRPLAGGAGLSIGSGAGSAGNGRAKP